MHSIAHITAGAAIAAILCLGASQAASHAIKISAAAPGPGGFFQTKMAVVSYGDLDPTTAEGAARLHERVVAAAKAVCGEGSRFVKSDADAKRVGVCIQQTTEEGFREIGLLQKHSA